MKSHAARTTRKILKSKISFPVHFHPEQAQKVEDARFYDRQGRLLPDKDIPSRSQYSREVLVRDAERRLQAAQRRKSKAKS